MANSNSSYEYDDEIERRHTSSLMIFKFEPDARAPSRKTKGAVGYDVYAGHDAVVPPRGKAVVRTNCGFIFPDGTYGRIAPRSGLAAKHHIDVGAGVIDPDYCGNVGVVLFNHGSEPLRVGKGDRIAQLILEKFAVARKVYVYNRPPPQTGDRKAGGYGSTGR